MPADVSVVIGAYNAMPYLARCLDSVRGQTIGGSRIEVIAVDDGSTDGTAAELDRFAASFPTARVVHQANSGTPAAPRNLGIGLSRGRYLLFLDADDYLGSEALARMVAAADHYGSDVVLGRRVGVAGRKPQRRAFRRTLPRADLFTSDVWWCLSAQKLFRKALIDRLGLRFPHLKISEDHPFGGMAYLHADVITVLADYDYYYLVRRDDGGNTTTVQRDIRDPLQGLEIMTRMVADHVPPGEHRDRLLERHFAVELRRACFARRYLAADRRVRIEAVTRAKALLDEFYTPRIAAAVPVATRVRCELISRERTDDLARLIELESAARAPYLIEDSRVYHSYPLFRDPEAGVPDEVFDVTNQLRVRHKLTELEWRDGRLLLAGYAFLAGVDTVSPGTRVVLRERSSAATHHVATQAEIADGLTQRYGKGRNNYDRAGFRVLLDPASVAGGSALPAGVWDLYLSVRHQGVKRTVRLGRIGDQQLRPEAKALARHVTIGEAEVRSYFTEPGQLALEVHEAGERAQG